MAWCGIVTNLYTVCANTSNRNQQKKKKNVGEEWVNGRTEFLSGTFI